MLLSRSCTYGLQLLAYLATQGERFVTIEEISQETEGPAAFLAKIVQQLHRAGLIRTRRGPQGGIQLARAAEAITLREVIDILDKPERFEQCVLGFRRCSALRPCAIHVEWAPIKEEINHLFEKKTIADLIPNPSTKPLIYYER